MRKEKSRTIIKEEATWLYTHSCPRCPYHYLYHLQQEKEAPMTPQRRDMLVPPVPSYHIADGAPVAS